MNLPAQGAWNGQTVVLGTGEIRLDAGTHMQGRTCCWRVVPGSGDVDNQWPWETAECRAEVGGGRSSDDSRDNRTRFERRASSQVCVTTSDNDCEIAVSAINSPALAGQVNGLEETLGLFANVGGMTECG